MVFDVRDRERQVWDCSDLIILVMESQFQILNMLSRFLIGQLFPIQGRLHLNRVSFPKCLTCAHFLVIT